MSKQAFHAEGAGFVHKNRHHAWSQRLVTQQLGEKTYIGLGGGNFSTLHRRLGDGLECVHRWHGEALIGFGAPVRQIATQGFTALVQVAHLWRVVSGLVKRQFGQLAVWDGDIEAVTEDFDVFVGQLLGLVYGVFALAGGAHTKAFDSFDQQHRRLTFVLHCRGIGGIDLLRVVAATAQIPNIVVA